MRGKLAAVAALAGGAASAYPLHGLTLAVLAFNVPTERSDIRSA
jgi:hypothetical protein